LSESWQYLSVLKGLEAEYRALGWLSADDSAVVTPLIQLWHKVPKSETGEGAAAANDAPGPSQSELFGRQRGEIVWQRLEKQLLRSINRTWLPDRPILLDGDWLEDAEAFDTVLANCRMAARRPLPVTGLDRPPDYASVVARAVQADAGGVVLRLTRNDFRTRTAGELEAAIDAWAASLGLSPSEVDVVLDLRVVQSLFRERDERFVESMLGTLPHIGDWRNLALVGSGMPANAKSFQRNDITPFARPEWWVWLALRQLANEFARLPIFGDYGVIHPDRVEAIGNPKINVRIPAVMYTSHDDCLMVRGKDLNRGWTVADVGRLFRRLMDGPDWCDRDFSKGDAWIADVESGQTETAGGWMSWKRAGQCHHWTYVSRQLANLLDS
jgi:hypothetical protein